MWKSYFKDGKFHTIRDMGTTVLDGGVILVLLFCFLIYPIFYYVMRKQVYSKEEWLEEKKIVKFWYGFAWFFWFLVMFTIFIGG